MAGPVSEPQSFKACRGFSADGSFLRPQPLKHHLADGRNRAPAKRKFDLACGQPQGKRRDGVARAQRHAKPSGKCHSDTNSVGDRDASARQHPMRTSLSGNLLSGLATDARKGVDRENWLGDDSSNSVDLKSLKPSTLYRSCLKEDSGASVEIDQPQKIIRRKGLKDSTNIVSPSIQRSQKMSIKMVCSGDHEIVMLREALRAEKEAFRCLQVELEEERNASSSAANEAMAMIARLQEEKAAVLMEARQFKRMAEEREVHNQEAIALLKEMLFQKEEDTLVLENDLAACRRMLLGMEEQTSARHLGTIKFLGSGRTHADEGALLPFPEGQVEYLNSVFESKEYAGSVKSFCDKFCRKELTRSQFLSKRKRKCLKDMNYDSVKSNLVSIFNQANEAFEESQASGSSEDHSSIPNLNLSGLHKVSATSSMLKKTMTSRFEDANIPMEHSSSFSSSKVVVNRPDNAWEGMRSSRFGLEGKDDTSGSVWERIMSLEYRLENFGMNDQLETLNDITMLPSEVREENDRETSEAHGSKIQGGLFFLDCKVDRRDSIERPSKIQCLEGMQVEHNARNDENVWHLSSSATIVRMDQDSSNVSRAPSDQLFGNAREEVHDVYEVGHMNNLSRCLKRPDSTPVMGVHMPLTCLVRDTGESDFPSSKESTSPVKIQSSTPQGSATMQHAGLYRNDVRQLTAQLQLLENEKLFTNRIIESLKKENKELKVLKEIAQQVQGSKRNVNTFNKRSREELRPFLSFLKGFPSFLPCSAQPQENNLTSDRQTGAIWSDRLGLTCLLERTPQHMKSGALMVRGSKVQILH